MLNEGLIHEELENIESADKRVEMLDKLLMECKDALQLVRDDLKNDPVSSFLFVMSDPDCYISHVFLNVANEAVAHCCLLNLLFVFSI